ncbi:DUF952 domain-containing protein [Nocardiopsis sediminis]|uniref:DUF952 domain-containing protein n=1 Tax=Nocardiopsis sediminis TaxID=1778267 RepID=A0ABV8FI99_9ACTN
MAELLHLTELERWRDGTGDITAPSLATEGFVHASPDEATLLAVAGHFYAATPADLVVLVIDTGRLAAEVRWEAAAPSPPPGVPGDTLFPHIYGPIPRTAVTEVATLRRGPDGTYTGLEPLEDAPAPRPGPATGR